MKIIKSLLVLTFIVLSFCKEEPAKPINIQPIVEKTDVKVLFVGNSYTYYNDGVDFHLQKMLKADLSSDSLNYFIQKIAVGAYTLEAHCADQLTINKIKSEKWNVVVLQEQSTRPINNPDLFLEYATKLDTEIKKVNSKTSLYMTWAPKIALNDIDSIAKTYQWVGINLNAEVAPVGKVWEYMQKSNPEIELYISDNKHPTLEGTFTAVCVFYSSLFKKNPKENSYVPSGMSLENAIAIRKAVFDYMNQP